MQVHADVEIADSPRAGIWISAPNIHLHAELNSLPSGHPIASVIHNLFFVLNIDPFPNLQISISSSIPVASGLGSGAAVSVALIRALYAKPVYFVKGLPSPGRRWAGGEVQILKASKPLTIVIGDTGVHAPTKESVSDVRKLWEADKAKWEKVFDEVGEIAKKAREKIESDAWEKLGELMNQNHALLQNMTVSSPELDKLVSAARQAGALGAKMSGGGRGGNMIALVEPEIAEAVSRSLKDAGAKNTIITTVSP
ncbi:MAG: hypothetical protein HYR93_08760 [Chloroflexi bacterium]|nr:hypothetical protein [Chloroflexota bacterium]